MKKLIASILALSVITAVFCSCGKDELSSSEENSSSKAESSIALEETEPIEEVTEAPTEKETEKSAESQEIKNAAELSEEDYITMLKDFCETAQNGSYEEIIRASLPNCIADSMLKVDIAPLGTNIMGEFGQGNIDLDSIEISSVESIDSSVKTEIEKYYTMIDMSYKMLADSGITEEMIRGEEEIPDSVKQVFEEMSGIMESEDGIADSDITVKLENCAYVNYVLNGEDWQTIVYNVNGEEPKIDLIFAITQAYVDKSKQLRSLTDAKTIYTAANASILELCEEGIEFNGVNIVSSAPEKNVLNGISEDTLEKLFDKMEHFYDEIDDKEFFLVLNKDFCEFAVVCENDKTAAYPEVSIFDDETVEQADSLPEFDELYDEVLKNLSKLDKR